VDDLLRHVDHVVALVGIRHVGIGFDFCSGFENHLSLPHALNTYDVLPGHDHLQAFTGGLLRRGYREEDIQRILGENFRRVYKKVLN
jgi:membrane dipeptidase